MQNTTTTGYQMANMQSDSQELLNLLEQIQPKEHLYLKGLLVRMESMETQIKELNAQIAALRVQLNPEQSPTIYRIYERTETSGRSVLQTLRDIKTHIATKGREYMAQVKQRGQAGLYSFLEKCGLRPKLEQLQQKLNTTIGKLNQDISRLDGIESELRQSGAHLQNAARLLMKKDDLIQAKDPSHLFSKHLLAARAVYQKSLDKVNGAIQRYEKLENTVIKNNLKNNPSVRKKLQEFKNRESITEENKEQELPTKQPDLSVKQEAGQSKSVSAEKEGRESVCGKLSDFKAKIAEKQQGTEVPEQIDPGKNLCR